jgi:hypothetical protein
MFQTEPTGRSLKSWTRPMKVCQVTKASFYKLKMIGQLVSCSVSDPDPDPDWIGIQSGQWIRIRNPDPGGQKLPTKMKS